MVLVLIPIHRLPLSPSENFSVQRTCEVLANWDVAFLCPERLKALISLVEWPRNDIQIISYPDHYFASVDGYNRLLMSKAFYANLLPYDHLLIVQPDALVISDQLAFWCERNWTFIGAPWFKGFDKVNIEELTSVGNGGFSLRNVTQCLRVLENQSVRAFFRAFCRAPINFVQDFWIRARKRYKLFPDYNEDYFFGVLASWLDPEIKIPEPNEALQFAFEVKPQRMYEMNEFRLPFGCHAFDRYDSNFWRVHIPELNSCGRKPA